MPEAPHRESALPYWVSSRQRGKLSGGEASRVEVYAAMERFIVFVDRRESTLDFDFNPDKLQKCKSTFDSTFSSD